MDVDQTAHLLAIISSFDNRSLSRVTAAAWSKLLRDVDFDDAEAAVYDFFDLPDHGYLEIQHIKRIVLEKKRLTPEKIEEDVRSAVARKWLPIDADRTVPLSPEMSQRLARARAGFAEQERAIEEQAWAAGAMPINPGTIGKEIPNA